MYLPAWSKTYCIQWGLLLSRHAYAWTLKQYPYPEETSSHLLTCKGYSADHVACWCQYMLGLGYPLLKFHSNFHISHKIFSSILCLLHQCVLQLNQWYSSEPALLGGVCCDQLCFDSLLLFLYVYNILWYTIFWFEKISHVKRFFSPDKGGKSFILFMKMRKLNFPGPSPLDTTIFFWSLVGGIWLYEKS